jgi:hypothetical protein
MLGMFSVSTSLSYQTEENSNLVFFLLNPLPSMLALPSACQALAKNIVEANYPPIPQGFTPLLESTVRACLSPEPDTRPDILGVC